MFGRWLRSLRRTLARTAPASRPGRRARGGQSHRLQLEPLEARTVPTFVTASGSPISLPNVPNGSFQPHSVVAADLNGDGIQDIALGSALTPGVVDVLTGQGNGTFQSAGTVTYGGSSDGFIRSTTAADLSGDGKSDLIAVNASANPATVTILQNTTASAGAAPTFNVLRDVSVGGGNNLF
jgi:hypothetical protein